MNCPKCNLSPMDELPSLGRYFCPCCLTRVPMASPPPTPPDATIDEAVEAFNRGACIFIESCNNIWFLVGSSKFEFVCANNPKLGHVYLALTPADCIRNAIDADPSHVQLYLAPSLSTVLNAFDL